MRKFLTGVIGALLCIVGVGCKDPYKDYVTTDLSPQNANPYMCVQGKDFDNPVYNDWNKVELIKTFERYEAYRLDLGYTEGYFENNWLAIILKTSNSSDGFSFVEVLENENILYPVIEKNEIEEGGAVPDDVIYHLYYVEVAANGGYELGDIVYRNS